MATAALSAAQKHAVKEHLKGQIDRLSGDVGLRQWCVEQAVASLNDHPGAQNQPLVDIARQIHTFVTEHATAQTQQAEAAE